MKVFDKLSGIVIIVTVIVGETHAVDKQLNILPGRRIKSSTGDKIMLNIY